MLYELDVRSIGHNLLATLTRRPEAYHRKVLAGADGRNDVASVSRSRRLQAGRPRQPSCSTTRYPRKSLLDHFYDPRRDAGAVALRRGAGAGRLPVAALRSPAAPQSAPHAGATVRAGQRRRPRRCGSPRA